MTKNDFYRYCRLVHGWISAFALVALFFFSFTGLLLNHPEWFSESPVSIVKHAYTLTESELQQLRAATEPSSALVGFVAKRVELKGTLNAEEAGGNQGGNDVYVRLRGVRGVSILHADLRSGALEVSIETPPALAMLNELHRAERAGPAWKLTVDVIAILLIVLSLIGYLIFLSIRGRRLRTAILLTVGGALGMGAIFFFAVS